MKESFNNPEKTKLMAKAARFTVLKDYDISKNSKQLVEKLSPHIHTNQLAS